MKNTLIILRVILCILFLWMKNSNAQHTYSIVAVDTVTQQVGSAGASWVPDLWYAMITKIFSVHPGVGAINTQAWYEEQNQIYVNLLMDIGVPPQGIIDAVIANDATGDPSFRQYLAIDLVDGGRTAAYTGASCWDYANHLLGKNYVIAGNILYGQHVLDSMETRFLNTSGSLADKLMAALQGGKEAGGDRRGEQYNISSLFSTVRVAKPDDSIDSLYIDLFVALGNFTQGNEPDLDSVDSLQTLYDNWKSSTNIKNESNKITCNYNLSQNYPNPFNSQTIIEYQLHQAGHVRLEIYNTLGQKITTIINQIHQAGHFRATWNGKDSAGRLVPSGIYFYRLETANFSEVKKMLLLP